jgi:hypothetical protein
MYIPVICKLLGHKFFYRSITEDGKFRVINHISFCHRCGLERQIINEEAKKSFSKNEKCPHCEKDIGSKT